MKDKNINVVYLGSAQLDKKAEYDAFLSHSEYSIIFVTLEWIAKEENHAKLNSWLKQKNLASLHRWILLVSSVVGILRFEQETGESKSGVSQYSTDDLDSNC